MAANPLKKSSQPFKERVVAFPQRYLPITDIAIVVVMKKIGVTPTAQVPDGYERLNVDLNKGRRGTDVPHVFLCVRRDGASSGFFLCSFFLSVINIFLFSLFFVRAVLKPQRWAHHAR